MNIVYHKFLRLNILLVGIYYMNVIGIIFGIYTNDVLNILVSLMI